MITPDKREYRAFSAEPSEDMRVTGQPVIFNSPTVMFEYDGIKYYEQISDRAFDGANMSDVVFVVNHDGTPAARTRNNTLKLDVRGDGVYMDADLSKSSIGSSVYSDIKNGVFDRMSFAFTVAKHSYDSKTRTRTIEKIDRLYDVSAVTFPAYEQTSISARSFFEAEAEKERLAEAIRQKRESIKNKIKECLK